MTVVAMWNSEGQFSGNSAQKDCREHCKHHYGGAGLMVANHHHGGESSVVVTTLVNVIVYTWPDWKAVFAAKLYEVMIDCSGLNNDHVAETFALRHTIDGNSFPCRYIKIGELLHFFSCWSLLIVILCCE